MTYGDQSVSSTVKFFTNVLRIRFQGEISLGLDQDLPGLCRKVMGDFQAYNEKIYQRKEGDSRDVEV